jgi:hypothetical protein
LDLQELQRRLWMPSLTNGFEQVMQFRFFRLERSRSSFAAPCVMLWRLIAVWIAATVVPNAFARSALDGRGDCMAISRSFSTLAACQRTGASVQVTSTSGILRQPFPGPELARRPFGLGTPRRRRWTLMIDLVTPRAAAMATLSCPCSAISASSLSSENLR